MEPFLGNANERKARMKRRLNVSIERRQKDMFVLRIARSWNLLNFRETQKKREKTINFETFLVYRKKEKLVKLFREDEINECDLSTLFFHPHGMRCETIHKFNFFWGKLE